MVTPMRETQAPLSTMARTNLDDGESDVKTEDLKQTQQSAETQQAAPFTRQRGKAARLDVDPAVSVGLVLVR